jgi:hypothetical protein
MYSCLCFGEHCKSPNNPLEHGNITSLTTQVSETFDVLKQISWDFDITTVMRTLPFEYLNIDLTPLILGNLSSIHFAPGLPFIRTHLTL